MNEDLIATITNARFTPVFKEGYAMGVVDEFLDGLLTRLSVGAPVRPMIEATRFPIARWQEAYSRAEVDLLLSQVKHKALVRDLEAEPLIEEAAAPPVAAEPRIPAPRAETVVEKKGVLARFFSSQ